MASSTCSAWMAHDNQTPFFKELKAQSTDKHVRQQDQMETTHYTIVGFSLK